MSANGIFHTYPKTTNPGINNNVTVLLASGIVCYQHKDYFQDKLILQIISEIASNRITKQVAFVSFSHQYNEIFYY